MRWIGRTLAGAVVVAGLVGAYEAGRGTRAPVTPAVAKDPAGQDDIKEQLEALRTTQVAMRNEVVALRNQLRDRAAPPATTVAAVASVPVPEKARSAEAIASEEAARTILDVATAQGRWTDDDRAKMHKAMAETDDAGRQALLRELAVAVNSQRLSLKDTHGPPL
jgi:hypothetical protein